MEPDPKREKTMLALQNFQDAGDQQALCHRNGQTMHENKQAIPQTMQPHNQHSNQHNNQHHNQHHNQHNNQHNDHYRNQLQQSHKHVQNGHPSSASDKQAKAALSSISQLQATNNMPHHSMLPIPLGMPSNASAESMQAINHLSEQMLAHVYSNMKRPANMPHMMPKPAPMPTPHMQMNHMPNQQNGQPVPLSHMSQMPQICQVTKMQPKNQLPKKRSAEEINKYHNGDRAVPLENGTTKRVVKRTDWLHNHSRLCGFHYPRVMKANKESGETRKQGTCAVCQKRGVGIRCMVCRVFLHCEGTGERNCYWKFHNLKDYGGGEYGDGS